MAEKKRHSPNMMYFVSSDANTNNNLTLCPFPIIRLTIRKTAIIEKTAKIYEKIAKYPSAMGVRNPKKIKPETKKKRRTMLPWNISVMNESFTFLIVETHLPTVYPDSTIMIRGSMINRGFATSLIPLISMISRPIQLF